MTRTQKIVAVLSLMLVLPLSAVAQNKEENKSGRESPPAVWKSERNFKAVQEAWELVANEQYAEAETEFTKLMADISDPYEKSQAMFGLAQALMARERFDRALELYEQIVRMDVLPNKPHFDAMFQIAQLYYMRERYEKALEWIDIWTRESGEVRVEAYELKASIYAQQEKYRDALTNIDKAIAMSDKPKESWYQLKLAMHYEMDQFQEAREVLEILVRGWPDKKQYWVQLASINVTLKRDREALAVLALAKRKGMLDKEQDWMQLYSLYGYLDVPFMAASTLAEGIEKNIVEPDEKIWEQLGNAWYAAQELDKAVNALKEAAELSEDGKLDMQVAYILVDKENWKEAQDSLAAAIRKGGLSESETGNMYVLLGMSRLNTDNLDGARDAFREARRFPKARQAAQQWLNHMDELAKRESTG